jgi:predicted AAA+ superfamily ATPase
MLTRSIEKRLREAARQYPVVAVTGPRQSGKTTLVRAVFPKKPYVSLEDFDRRQMAEADPRSFLAEFPEGAILDEIQRVPALLSYLQTLVDEQPDRLRFVLTGSNQFLLMKGVAQSLAGRIALLKLLPFTFAECPPGDDIAERIRLGGYPRIHDRRLDPFEWHLSYIETYVEKDLKDLIRVADLGVFRRFLTLLASQCGQLLNLSALGGALGISHNTAKAWLAALEQSYLVFTLPPYHRNYGKRIVKTPKVYFTDTGLACALLRIRDTDTLRNHLVLGGLFENLIVAEYYKAGLHATGVSDLYFWRDHGGHEVDCLLERPDGLHPVEIKLSATLHPDFFAGLHRFSELTQTPPSAATLVYGGQETHRHHGIRAIGWRDVPHAMPVRARG